MNLYVNLFFLVHNLFETDLDVNNKVFYSAAKTYVVGTQKNRLIETVLLGTQNIFLK